MSDGTGTTIERRRPPWVSTVTRDAVRHFAWGIGDANPLWIDPDHATASRWHGLIAPPTSLYAIDETTVAPGLDDRRRFYQRVNWVWFDVVRDRTAIRATPTLTAEVEENGVVQQHGRVDFVSADGVLVARAETVCRRIIGATIAPADQPEVRYTGAELDEIERAITAETRRGSHPRFWEETAVGDDLGRRVKGPLSIMDVVAWCAATQGVATVADRYSEGGLLAQTATGPQQVAWIVHLLTDWMGDDAFLHRLDTTILSNPPLGSTTTIAGRVTDLSVTGAAPAARIEVTASNQWGELTATGTASVMLPSTENGPVRLPLDRAKLRAWGLDHRGR